MCGQEPLTDSNITYPESSQGQNKLVQFLYFSLGEILKSIENSETYVNEQIIVMALYRPLLLFTTQKTRSLPTKSRKN